MKLEKERENEREGGKETDRDRQGQGRGRHTPEAVVDTVLIRLDRLDMGSERGIKGDGQIFKFKQLGE